MKLLLVNDDYDERGAIGAVRGVDKMDAETITESVVSIMLTRDNIRKTMRMFCEIGEPLE